MFYCFIFAPYGGAGAGRFWWEIIVSLLQVMWVEVSLRGCGGMWMFWLYTGDYRLFRGEGSSWRSQWKNVL